MNISYFNEAAYEKLYHSIKENEQKYCSNINWVEDFFQNKPFFEKSGIDVSKIILESPKTQNDEQKNLTDLTNTKQLYGAWKDTITPLQATNKYMWSYLCHNTFYEYVVARWMQKPGKETIKTRFFMNGRNGKYDNAIARLWWFGYITYDYDKEHSNPFHLTEILLSSQQICTDLLDESYSNNKEIVRGMLSALEEIKYNYPQKGLSTPWRECVKYINRYGAIVNLDYIGSEKIKELTYNFLKTKIT